MNVVIIDDDQLVALSLQTILEACDDIQVSATGGSGADAIRLYEEYQPDVLLMDIRMENINGLEASETIMASHPDARILLLTTFSDDEYIIKALSIGAKGYILKQNFESIAPAVKAVYNGQTVFGDEIVGKLPDLIGHMDTTSSDVQPSPFAGMEYELSSKEMNIIRLVADGLNNKEIASSLYLSEGTVRNYISSILDKLQLRDRTQLQLLLQKANQLSNSQYNTKKASRTPSLNDMRLAFSVLLGRTWVRGTHIHYY